MNTMLPTNLKKLRVEAVLPMLAAIVRAYSRPDVHDDLPPIQHRIGDVLRLVPVVIGRVNRDIGDDALHAEAVECVGGVLSRCEFLNPAIFDEAVAVSGGTAEAFVTETVFRLMELEYADRLDAASHRLAALAASGHLRPRVMVPLTDIEQAIYDLLPEPPDGIMSAALLRRLHLAGHDVEQSNLSGRHIAALKVKRGVSNTSGVGYHR